jgi:hypothetical protein
LHSVHYTLSHINSDLVEAAAAAEDAVADDKKGNYLEKGPDVNREIRLWMKLVFANRMEKQMCNWKPAMHNCKEDGNVYSVA